MASVPLPAQPPQPSQIELLISALKPRVSWPILRQLLKDEKLPVGSGWDDLIANASLSTDSGAKLRAFLHAFYSETLVTGDRYVQLYQINSILTNSIIKELVSTTISSSQFSKSYPLPLDGTSLSTAPDIPTLCEVRHHKNGDVALVFCSSRAYDDRVTYAYSQLSPNVQKTYDGIDHLITIRKVYFQAYDTFIIRKTLERIEICVDYPAKTSADSIATLPIRILSMCALHLPSLVGFGARPPENLFSAIGEMYDEKSEGQVTYLAFRTKTGSIKKERMTSSDVDLRDEKFHHAGMNAIGNVISPYELTLEMNFKLPKGSATITLSALIRELASATPTLHGCRISTPTSTAFEQAVNRIVTYI